MQENSSASQAEEERTGLGPWLALALVLGLVRFFRLGAWSLWVDEALTFADAHHGTANLYNAPGYRAIRATVELLGGTPDEYALRFLPAVLGWATIPLTFWAFRPFAGGRRAGFAALLLALSSWHIYWSQNARFYTMAMVACVLGSGFVVRGLFRSSAPSALFGGFCVALGAGFQLQSALLLGALVAAPWALPALRLRLPRESRRAVLALLVLAVVGLVLRSRWLLDVWETYQQNKGVGAGAQVRSIGHFVLATGFYVTPVLGAGFLAGAVGALGARDRFHGFAALVVLLGVLAAVLASLFARVTAQYVFVLLPWIAIVAAWPMGANAAARASLLRFGYALLLILPAAANTGLYFFVRQGERPRWREAYHYVWEQRAPEDVVLGMAAPIAEFYLAPGRTDLRHPEVIGWLDKHRPSVAAQWSRHGRRVWIVIKPENLADWEPADREELRAFLREECRLMRRFPVDVEGRKLGLEVYLAGEP